MTSTAAERYRVAALGWLAAVATSLSFLPALEDKGYLIQGAVTSGLVVGVGVLLRALRTPPLLVLGLQLLTLVEVLLLRFGGEFKAWVLPTGATFAGIEDLLRTGVDVAQKYPAPAPADAGLLLMVLFAIALVAVLIDALAVGFGRPPLAGLPLLALYTVPVVALPTGVPFYAFVPGAATYIALLMAAERDRLSHWGRLVARSGDTPENSHVDMSGLNATGRRVSFLALSVAVVLPIFIPAISSSILDGGRSTGPGTGTGGTLSFEDPMVSLANDLMLKEAVDLLEVASDIDPRYLRLVVLATPGPNAWTAEPLDLSTTLSLTSELPPPTDLGPDIETSRHRMTVTLTDDFPDNSAWLPVPFDAKTVTSSADFAYVPDDQTVAARSESAILDVTPYPIDYSVISPTAEQLKAAGPAPSDIMRRFGEAPSEVPAVVGNTARIVTQGAETAYDQALLLQSYFRQSGGFDYDLDAGYGYGYDAMAEFLDQRRGFCQHFSATMAMMARELGIPSRIVVGFLQSSHTNAGNQYVFTSHNVHSWPELYFGGVGWVRFEPTPGVNASVPPYAQLTTPPTSSTTPTGTVSTSAPTSINEPPSTGPDTGTQVGGSSGSSGSGGPLPSRGWLIALGLIALMLLPAALRQGVRRARLTRPLDAATAAEAAWLELRDHLGDLRLPWRGSLTPRAREKAVAPLLYDDANGLAALHRLAMSVERARYSTSLAPDAAPAADAKVVRAAVSREADRSQRIRAFFWPSSLMPDMQRGWARVGARLGGRKEHDPTVVAQ